MNAADGYLEDLGPYWDRRFETEGKVWGEQPSATAVYAKRLFDGRNIAELLVPGAGYGRNTKLFSMEGYRVTGIEISAKALQIAALYDPGTAFIHASALDDPVDANRFDAVYCFNVLHLFREEERKMLVSLCGKWLKPTGCAFFTVFSIDEPSFGKGRKAEMNTFESKPGRPVHYFSDTDLREHFREFDILESGVMEDPENHGAEGAHIHRVAYIYANNG